MDFSPACGSLCGGKGGMYVENHTISDDCTLRLHTQGQTYKKENTRLFTTAKPAQIRNRQTVIQVAAKGETHL